MAQSVNNPPAMQETQVQSLGQEDPLEKEMATHSSILAWEIPWTEEPGGLLSMGSQELDTTLQLNLPPTTSSNGIYPRMQRWYNIQKSINIIHHLNRMKEQYQ